MGVCAVVVVYTCTAVWYVGMFIFCFCSLLKNQTVPKERHTPHGGSDKSTTRNFGDHLY